jgi:HNH endonuclease
MMERPELGPSGEPNARALQRDPAPTSTYVSSSASTGRLARRQYERARAQLKRDFPEGPCAWCGRAIPEGLPRAHPLAWRADHVAPVSRGGASDIENLRPMHHGCNSARQEGGKKPRTRGDRSAAW